MTAVWATFVRELRAYFLSPLGYVVLFLFLLANGWVFASVVSILNDPRAAAGQPLELFFSTFFLWFVLVFFAPALTMRLLAEERKSGSIEVLMTAPVTEGQVVLGKYLGVLVFYLFLWLPTVLYTLILSAYAEVDWGPIAAGYLGVVGIGALLLAAGLFASAVVADQLVAAILAFALMVPLVFGGLLLELLVDAPWLQDVLAYVNVIQHQQDFAQGIVDTRRLVYYLSATVFFLFLASRSLEGNKWR